MDRCGPDEMEIIEYHYLVLSNRTNEQEFADAKKLLPI